MPIDFDGTLGISATGNITGSYILGNGSQLTGLSSGGYSNSNVSTYLAGNITTNIIPSGASQTLGNAANPWQSLYVSNATIYIGSVPISVASGNVLQVNGANVVTSGSNAVNTGNVTTTGNISGTYILGDGSQLTNLPAGNYSNANVAAYLPTYTGNLVALTGNVTTTANISGNYILGNGSLLTGITGTYGNSNVATYLPTYSGNIANLTVTGNLIATTQGNSDSSNLVATTQFVQNIVTTSGGYGNAQVAVYLPTYTGNLAALTGNVTTTANISGNYILGDGSQLTNLPPGNYSNANVAAYLPTYTGNLVALTGNVTTTANISGNYILGNGSALTGITASTANSATTAGTVTGNAQANITSVGTLSNLTVGGNTFVTAGMFRLPSYTSSQVAALSGMTGGELVYNTTLNVIQGYQINPATSSMDWVSWTVATYQ